MEFLNQMEAPFDFAVHDAAHDYEQTKLDLEKIFPMMRQYSLVCIHDTHGEHCGREMTAALKEAAKQFSVSYIHVPYCQGLTILRVEDSPHPFVAPPWSKGEGWPETVCFQDSPGRMSMGMRMFGWGKSKLRSIKRVITSRGK